ncbi:hypothetical protein VIM7927_04385 [Vibrio mangrovi]|uniref:Uncharacterized protein n=1 Tax=Vibrio mangrovi TaxID=474394 RepID=A0A1Y6J2T3_9VIBR|nr:hypothetical protein VIM7927_04385 [Vibrio mangrovi]
MAGYVQFKGGLQEYLDIPVATGLSGDEVVITLESITAFRGYPAAIRTDQRVRIYRESPRAVGATTACHLLTKIPSYMQQI